MSKSFTTVPKWQRARVAELHFQFVKAERRNRIAGVPVRKAIGQVCEILSTKVLRTESGDYKPFKASTSTILDAYYKWLNAGKKPEALLYDYKPGRTQLPRKFFAELHRRATQPGLESFSVVINELHADWQNGIAIPGLGTWREWWDEKHPKLPLPHKAPDFPFTDRTLYRAQPSKRERATGNRGIAAGRSEGPHVSMNYSKLRKCELFTLDDVRLDILCTDEATGKAIEVVCYILMEVASRMIVAYVLRPAAHITSEDVDELLAYGLQRFGIGDGYVTHIIFERGTVACSEAAELALKTALTDEDGKACIRIHRTSMDEGVRWIGSPRDKASGHAVGKAVIESFNRKLHLMLMNLPGQRGSNFRKQPASLGYEGAGKASPGSLVDECQKLAGFQLLANSGKKSIGQSERLRLVLGMLYLDQLDAAVQAAIEKHNSEDGHDYKGHGTFEVRETAPGVWDEPDADRDDRAASSSTHTLTPALVAPNLDASVTSDSAIVAPSGAGAVSEGRDDRAASSSLHVIDGKKTYALKNAPTKTPTTGEYWRLWKAVEALNPRNKKLRHALTHRALGCHPEVKDMTPDQLGKMIDVFTAILRGRRSARQATK